MWPFLAIRDHFPRSAGWQRPPWPGQTRKCQRALRPAASSVLAPAARGVTGRCSAECRSASVEPTLVRSSSSALSAEPDHGAVISVLNGTETQGFAAQKVTILNDTGTPLPPLPTRMPVDRIRRLPSSEGPRKMEATAECASSWALTVRRADSAIPDVIVLR